MTNQEEFVLETINLALQREGLKPLQHVNDSTNGGEWNGPCIKCARESGNGGDNRFRVNPNRPIEDETGMRKDPLFVCRQCSREDKPDAQWSGDLVEYVRYVYYLGYREARTFLHLPPKAEVEHAYGYTGQDTGVPKEAPSKTWQNRAAAFIRDAQQRLFSTAEGNVALRYLKETRKLTDNIIHEAQLGFHYPNTTEEGKVWGVDGLVSLPAGIVIPSWYDLNIMGLSIRLPQKYVNYNYLRTGNEIRYNTVKGSVPTLYGTKWIGSYKPGTPLVICEGQFDALTLAQEYYPDLAVFATGSAQNNQNVLPIQLISLLGFDPILLAFDNDEAGQKATRFWLSVLNQEDGKLLAYPTKFPVGMQIKDVNEMAVSDVNIYEWIAKQIADFDRIRSMLTIPTVFGTRSNAYIEVPKTAQISVVESAITPVWLEVPTSLTHHAEKIDNVLEEKAMPDDVTIEAVESVEVPLVESVQEIPYHVHVISTLDELYEEIRVVELQGYPPYLCLDLETTGLNPRKNKIISLSYGTPDRVTIIDVRPAYTEHFYEYQQALQTLFMGLNATTTWIGHNLKFDMNFLEVQFEVKLQKVYDTMLVDRVLYAGLPEKFGLDATAERYHLSVSKQERNWFIDLDTRPEEWSVAFPVEQLVYMAQDIEIPYQIWEKQYDKIKDQNLTDTVNLEHIALPAISAMEVAGVLIDVDRWSDIIAKTDVKRATLDAQLQNTLGKAYLEYRETLPIALTKTGKPKKVKEVTGINLASPLQLKQAFQWLGFHLEGTDKDVLVQHKAEHPAIPILLEWKQSQKFLTSFGEKMLSLIDEDGRIHASFEQLGTVTGRMSCHDPNLQQVPKNPSEEFDIRACFVAREGYKLLVADLSNIELRILADQSGDTNMLRMFAEGLDLHSQTARLMFGIADDQDPAEVLINGKPARFIAKTINFGLAYGLQAPGLARRVDVTEEQAAEFIAKYFAMFPGVKRYLDRLASQALNRGYSMTVLGRRRYYAGTREQRFSQAFRGEIERAAKNHPIQGTNADILKISLALLYNELPDQAKLVLTVHDEIVIECPEHLLEQCTAIMQRCMEEACKSLLHTVTIPQQKVVVSDHWTK